MNHEQALEAAATKVCGAARTFKHQGISILGARGGVVATEDDPIVRLTFDDAVLVAVRAYLTARAERKSFAKLPADQDITDEEYRQAMDAGRGYAELLLRDFDV